MKVIRYSGISSLEGFSLRAEKLNNTPSGEDPHFEVYDLDSDPEEINNLAAQPTQEIQVLIDELESFYRQNVEFPK